MKLNLLKRAAVLPLLLALLIPAASAQAAVDHAVVADFTEGSTAGYFSADTHFLDGMSDVNTYFVDLPIGMATDTQGLISAADTAIQGYATTQGYTLSKGIVWPTVPMTVIQSLIASSTASLATVARTGSYTDLSNLPPAPSSYQTIVSQTGTAAPAVSGSFLPMNSYSGSPTFTWARTGAGVYTLTASSAVFNTSGKTGIFITPPQNLNGSFKAVVTSSTVITVTTAVQSLAILGLLGFTATPTDAMLTGTMVYVQTYP